MRAADLSAALGGAIGGLILAVGISCGNPGNFVDGAVLASGNVPAGALPAVQSSIYADSSSDGLPLRRVVMSDVPRLCDLLAGDPGFLAEQSHSFVALVLQTRADQLGRFSVGAPGVSGAFIISTGNPSSSTAYPIDHCCSIFVSDDRFGSGGTSDGSFQLLVDDAGSDLLSGAFQADDCPALIHAR